MSSATHVHADIRTPSGMKISVIIVNYNVRAYLEQCLRTVQEALKGIEGDVFVVDNQSTDGSVEMVREKFPHVKLIANTENVGFSRANNQAIRASGSEYILLLNPDTVVGEGVFHEVLAFLDRHPNIGGLGVKMIDGTGAFLPESKRGLPTPAVAFYKIIGLTRLFPRSRMFGRYHLGHLPENEPARIEILSGACMFLRKVTLDKVGLLDESFFMYGEDIDLSYRITLGGFENWYFPKARIIHYKGESTKKSSVNYVFVFYNAMAIFAKKHFTRRGTDFFSLLINGSIYLSAAGAIISRFLRRALLPMFDLGLVLGVSSLMTWPVLMGGGPPTDLSGFPIWAALLSQACIALFGGYDLPVRLQNVVKAMLVFAALLAMVNVAFLEGTISTGSLLAIPAGSTGCYLATRSLLHLLRLRGYSLRSLDRRRVLAIGSPAENRQALALLWQTHFGLGRQAQLSAADVQGPDGARVIKRTIRKKGVDEVVFCARDLAWERIIDLMEDLRKARVMFKIAQPAREFIIGPNSIESINDLYIMERHAVNSAGARRSKRLLDLSLAALFLTLLPVMLLCVRDRAGFLGNWWHVVCGRKTWVGYGPLAEGPLKLPTIRQGIIDPTGGTGNGDVLTIHRANVVYAKDYSTWTDLRAILRGLSSLGRA